MTWVLDKGLAKLRDQVDAAWPDRDKSSDGTIGNAAHAAGVSDHNPEHPAPKGNPDYQVDAMDITHDPAHGADMQAVFDALRESRDQRISYLIHNGHIMDGDGGLGRPGNQPWVVRKYTGSNPHTHHLHVSVGDDHHDETQDWAIGVNMDLTAKNLDDIATAVINKTWALSQAESDLAGHGAFPAPTGSPQSIRLALTYGERVARSEDRGALNAVIAQSRSNGNGLSALQLALSALAAKVNALTQPVAATIDVEALAISLAAKLPSGTDAHAIAAEVAADLAARLQS